MGAVLVLGMVLGCGRSQPQPARPAVEPIAEKAIPPVPEDLSAPAPIENPRAEERSHGDPEASADSDASPTGLPAAEGMEFAGSDQGGDSEPARDSEPSSVTEAVGKALFRSLVPMRQEDRLPDAPRFQQSP